MNLMASATTKEPIDLDIRDGKLYCNQCGEVMRGDGGCISTAMAFNTTGGHYHDCNTSRSPYYCRNNHCLVVSKAHKCPKPGCTWSQVGERSFLHDGPKLEEWPE